MFSLRREMRSRSHGRALLTERIYLYSSCYFNKIPEPGNFIKKSGLDTSGLCKFKDISNGWAWWGPRDRVTMAGAWARGRARQEATGKQGSSSSVDTHQSDKNYLTPFGRQPPLTSQDTNLSTAPWRPRPQEWALGTLGNQLHLTAV